MSRLVDGLSILLLVFAGVAFTLGVAALGDQRDLNAVYWLIVGGLLLKTSAELLRPSREQ